MSLYVIQNTRTGKYWAAGTYTEDLGQATAFENQERSSVKLYSNEKWVKL